MNFAVYGFYKATFGVMGVFCFCFFALSSGYIGAELGWYLHRLQRLGTHWIIQQNVISSIMIATTHTTGILHGTILPSWEFKSEF